LLSSGKVNSRGASAAYSACSLFLDWFEVLTLALLRKSDPIRFALDQPSIKLKSGVGYELLSLFG
jgi:hypothetical protein